MHILRVSIVIFYSEQSSEIESYNGDVGDCWWRDADVTVTPRARSFSQTNDNQLKNQAIIRLQSNRKRR